MKEGRGFYEYFFHFIFSKYEINAYILQRWVIHVAGLDKRYKAKKFFFFNATKLKINYEIYYTLRLLC